ncbi:hypothetical protein FPOAC2_11175 [Fusarium poae]
MQTRGVTLIKESLASASRAATNHRTGRDRDSYHLLNSHAAPWTIPTPLPDSQLPIPHIYGFVYQIDAVCVDGLMNNAILHIPSTIDATIYLLHTFHTTVPTVLKPSGYRRLDDKPSLPGSPLCWIEDR